MRQISILGCGWLGLPLATSLLEKGFAINGSTTSSEKIAVLKDSGIRAFQIEVSEAGITGDMASFLESSEILIIDIPPKLRQDSAENFVEKIKNIIPFIKKSSVEKVIFISSTSVYNDGYANVTEETSAEPDTESGKQLLEVEKLLLLNIFDFSHTVIRFGGLIGGDRHPVYQLAGKKGLRNPSAPINLIHLNDCIGIIQTIIDRERWNDTFNAVAPFHPSRSDYYSQKAIELGLPLPEFTEDTSSFGKVIHSTKLETDLHYKFQNPNL